MRDYGKVYSTFWTSDDTRALSDDAKVLALYVLTGPHTNLAGCFRLPDGYAAEDLGWTIERVSRGFADLFEHNFATRDEGTKWVVIHKYLKWNPLENPNQAKAALRLMAQIPATSQIRTIMAAALAQFGGRFMAQFLADPASTATATATGGGADSPPAAEADTPTPSKTSELVGDEASGTKAAPGGDEGRVMPRGLGGNEDRADPGPKTEAGSAREGGVACAKMVETLEYFPDISGVRGGVVGGGANPLATLGEPGTGAGTGAGAEEKAEELPGGGVAAHGLVCESTKPGPAGKTTTVAGEGAVAGKGTVAEKAATAAGKGAVAEKTTTVAGDAPALAGKGTAAGKATAIAEEAGGGGKGSVGGSGSAPVGLLSPGPAAPWVLWGLCPLRVLRLVLCLPRLAGLWGEIPGRLPRGSPRRSPAEKIPVRGRVWVLLRHQALFPRRLCVPCLCGCAMVRSLCFS